MAFYGAFWGGQFWNRQFQIARGGNPPPVPASGSSQGAPVGWGTGRKQRISGQRTDDIKIERRQSKGRGKLRVQEIDKHDIMLFVKTFRQFNQ